MPGFVLSGRGLLRQPPRSTSSEPKCALQPPRCGRSCLGGLCGGGPSLARSLARSLAQPRRNRRRRNSTQQPRATDLHARPGDTAAAAARARRTP